MRVETAAEKLFFSTVRINTTSAETTARMGTGFFFEHTLNQKKHRFVVTSKRTVSGKYGGHLSLLLGKNKKPALGNVFRYAIGEWDKSWFYHPRLETDIAILHFDPIEKRIKEKFGAEPFYIPINQDIIPTDTQIEEFNAVEPLLFVGYSDGTCDTSNWLPVVRSAITATPLENDFEGNPNFLMDARIYPGSCGSPIFIYNQAPYFNRNGALVSEPRVLFVGSLTTGHYRKQPDPVITHDQILWEQENTHLGLAVKANMVIEAIEAFAKRYPSET